jgi:hypothetical protein
MPAELSKYAKGTPEATPRTRKGRCQNTFPVTTGSLQGPTPPVGGLVAGSATPGGQFYTLYGPRGGPGRGGAGP